MTQHPHRASILGYFYLLIVVFAVSAAAVVGLTFFRYEADTTARNDLEQYHVRTVALATEVSSRIGVAQEIASGEGTATESSIQTAEREFVSAILGVREGIDEIAAIQGANGEESFEETVARASQRANSMATATDDLSWTPSRWQTELAAMDFTTFQLSRLHSTTIEEELTNLSRSNDQLQLITLLVTAIVLVACGVLVVRLIGLARQRLRELDETNAALLETQERLQQSQRLEALSTLVGGVAHDFNNLLATILGYAELALLNLDRDDPAYGPLRTIQSAGERAAALTKQLLAFSRHETGQPEPTDLNLLIRDLEPVIRGLIPSRVELRISCAPSARLVLVDPVQMEQVLLNLVVNARDAMPSGGELSIGTEHVDLTTATDTDRRGAFTRLTVEDTGSGMGPDIVTRMYEPFFTTKEAGRGTGLGLSVVHGIVLATEGSIDVQSEPEVGTRFDVYLPATAASDTGNDVSMPTPTNGGSESVLLVEDDQRIRELLAATLGEAGYDVTAVEDGEQALIAFRRSPDAIALVVTDVVMPGIRGPDLVNELRVSHPEIPAVFISGYGEEGALQSVRNAGDAFVHKPFKLRDLMGVVREQLDRAEPTGSQRGKF